MIETGNALSRNPNLCASCSSLADGMDEPSVASIDEPSVAEPPVPEGAAAAFDPSPEVKAKDHLADRTPEKHHAASH